MESLSLLSNLQPFPNHHPPPTTDLPPAQREEWTKILTGRPKEQQSYLLPRRLSLLEQQCPHPHPTLDPLPQFPRRQLPPPTLDLRCQQHRMPKIRMGFIKDSYTRQLSNRFPQFKDFESCSAHPHLKG